MPLAPGMRLGVYEIQSAIGAGGMGEVYRARDTELNRDVAIKVLPDAVAFDPDRVARFKREAQLLASLNHPNIAAIYGLEQADGVQALVLELVDGSTLAQILQRRAGPPGPAGIPLDEALPIARQIADALEAAHEQGVVHRDLKPANIKLRPDGTVKVLDFGLAKALDPVSAPGESQSPTMTSPAMTRLGMILGTAAYMAPEQARGHAVDRRADIWAFGCVLFEMLTGRRAFEGEDVAETLGAVIHKEPAWNTLPGATPAWVQTLLRRCLQKDPKKRLPHIGIARIEMDEAPAEGSATLRSTHAAAARTVWSNIPLAWSVAAAACAATFIAFGIVYFVAVAARESPQPTRTSILPPPDNVLRVPGPGLRFALSPDGRKLAFLATDSTGLTSLWVRPIDALTAQRLIGTEGVQMATWSPDGRFLAFVANGRVRRIDAFGGPPMTLASQATNTGLAWSAEDVILFSQDGGALFRVPASGGTPSSVTSLDVAAGERGHWHPVFLPDNRHFLYAAIGTTSDPRDARAVYVGSLDPSETPRMILEGGGANPKYASGHLLYLRESTLLAQPFDARNLVLTGAAVPLVEELLVGGSTGLNGAFSVSQTGLLVYQTGSANVRSQLAWYERSGKQIGMLGDPTNQGDLELSPDGNRVLVSVWDSAGQARDLWIYDTRRGLRTRFTFNPADEAVGAWASDGTRVVFNSSRRQGIFDLYHKAATGVDDEELLIADDRNKSPHGWSGPGTIIYVARGPRTLVDVWTVPFHGDRKAVPFLQTDFVEFEPRLSPDGRWLAYVSNESGRNEIYVTGFPSRRGKWQVSTAGGRFPRWRRDGREIFYLAGGDTLMTATVDGAGSAFQAGEVGRLFQLPETRDFGFRGRQPGYPYDVSADGQRFLFNMLREETSSDPLTLLVNWPALLRQ